MKPTLIVMVKEPRPGRVKTRLGRDIGMVEAAWWYRHHVGSLLRRLSDPRWRSVAAFAPDGMRKPGWQASAHWPQGNGHLGRRMLRMLQRAGPKSLLIGSDIDGVTRAHIARGFGAVGRHETVLGPAPDGGFWLIGLRHPGRVPVHGLDGVAWSTPDAMEQTAARLPGPIGFVDTLNDVDTAADLAMTR